MARARAGLRRVLPEIYLTGVRRSVMLLMLVGALGGCPRAPAPGPAAAAPADAVVYHCESGAELRAVYLPDEAVLLHHAGQVRRLDGAPRASGARFTGAGLEWWVKGDEARLSPLGADGWGGEPLERCASGVDAAAPEGAAPPVTP